MLLIHQNQKGEKPKTNFLKQELKRLEKNSMNRDKFSKSKINEIRKNLYEIENEKNLFASKIKKIFFTELEENLSKTKKYHDYDDTKYECKRFI